MLDPVQIGVLVLATVSMYAYRADFERYSIFTVGVFKRLDRAVVEGADYSCGEIHCEEQTNISERRRYYKEIVVAGMPVVRYDIGERHYCVDHVALEVLGDLDNPKRSKTERLSTTLTAAFAGFLEWKVQPEERDPFDDTIESVGTAFDLAGVAILVLFAAAIMSLMPERELEGDIK